jgi:hypothetical protein
MYTIMEPFGLTATYRPRIVGSISVHNRPVWIVESWAMRLAFSLRNSVRNCILTSNGSTLAGPRASCHSWCIWLHNLFGTNTVAKHVGDPRVGAFLLRRSANMMAPR